MVQSICPARPRAAHEPVLLPQSDIVLAVAGLSAVGKPLQEVCFRLETACTLLGVPPETILTPELLAKLLADEQGGARLLGRAIFMRYSTRPIRRSARPQARKPKNCCGCGMVSRWY